MDHFINHGYGWTCRHCPTEETVTGRATSGARARFFSEGEAEEREPKLSVSTLARWRDESHRELVCPKCGVVEKTEER
jgi:hypothetical protein